MMARIVEVDPNKKYVLIGNWNRHEADLLAEIWKEATRLVVISSHGDDVVIVPADQVVGYKILGDVEGDE